MIDLDALVSANIGPIVVGLVIVVIALVLAVVGLIRRARKLGRRRVKRLNRTVPEWRAACSQRDACRTP